MRRLLFAVAIASLIFAGPALAQELDGTWRPPPVGTKVANNFGTVYEVIAAEGGNVYVKGDRNNQIQNTSWSIYRGICPSMTYEGGAYDCDKKGIDSLFPLEVGKTATITWPPGEWRGKTTYKVNSVKTIKTVIGPRKVFGIVYTNKGTHGNNWRSKGFFYFAPALGFAHSGRDIEVSNDNWTGNWRIVCLDLPE